MLAAVFVTSGWTHVKDPKGRAKSIGFASIGYMLYGMPGAIVATLAIILPAADSAHRVGCTARDTCHDATAQVEHPRHAGRGNLSGIAAQMVTVTSCLQRTL